MERASPTEGNDLRPKEESVAEVYLADLGLDWDYLKGKRILDIGAGPGEFAKAAKKRGIEVVSLDDFTALGWEFASPERGIPFVAGEAGKLPFADGSFDMVISHAAPPNIMTYSKGSVAAIIHEVRRVLKDGGEYRFGVGNLDANIFREEKDESEERIGTTEEQIRLLREKSIEFLKSLDPRIEEVENKNPARFRVGKEWYHFYSLKKNSQEAVEK